MYKGRYKGRFGRPCMIFRIKKKKSEYFRTNRSQFRYTRPLNFRARLHKKVTINGYNSVDSLYAYNHGIPNQLAYKDPLSTSQLHYCRIIKKCYIYPYFLTV